jgi:hypothetical protein
MNSFDIICVTIIFWGACFGQAAYHSFLLKKDITADRKWHLGHGFVYFIFCAIVSYIYFTEFGWIVGLLIMIHGILTRLAFFDVLLNAIRGKSLWYNGPIDREPGSLIDWWENDILRVGEPGGIKRVIKLKIAYLVLWILYLTFLFIKYAIN